MGTLTAAEQALVTSLWISLCDAYPDRSFVVEARSLPITPTQEVVEITVADHGRIVTERVARAAMTDSRLGELRDSLLRAAA
jgi:hypothetical protein